MKKDELETKGIVLVSLAVTTEGRRSSLSNVCKREEIREEMQGPYRRGLGFLHPSAPVHFPS